MRKPSLRLNGRQFLTGWVKTWRWGGLSEKASLLEALPGKNGQFLGNQIAISRLIKAPLVESGKKAVFTFPRSLHSNESSYLTNLLNDSRLLPSLRNAMNPGTSCCCCCYCCSCCCCHHSFITALIKWSRRFKWGFWGGRPVR